MIVHINHIAPGKKKAVGRSPVSQLAGLVNGAMLSMVEDGVLDARLAPSLRVHLDWIQYKTNFRDPVMVRRTADGTGRPLPLAEIAVDLRRPPRGCRRIWRARSAAWRMPPTPIRSSTSSSAALLPTGTV